MRFKKRVDHRPSTMAPRCSACADWSSKATVPRTRYAFEWAIKRGYDAVKNGVLERLVRSDGGERRVLLQQAALDAGQANSSGGKRGDSASRHRRKSPNSPAEPGAAQSSKA